VQFGKLADVDHRPDVAHEFGHPEADIGGPGDQRRLRVLGIDFGQVVDRGRDDQPLPADPDLDPPAVSERREARLRDFFIAYGKQDRQPGEFVESIKVPYLPDGEKLACYKVTKRKDEDISALCGAFRVFVNDDGVVGMIRIAFGGMAATPKRAIAVEEALIGKPWTSATIEAAIPAFATDYQPLTDMRASAEYRLLAAQNLLRRFHLETTGTAERLSKAVA
jgi:xanthine dehydrogenase small subunit